MTIATLPATLKEESHAQIIYPDSDGQLMADSTRQFAWIVKIKEGLEALFKDDQNIFVAGDLLWYPIEGNNTLRRAPDVMVVFGRSKGDRGSYQQWQENNVAPQVVFEILSEGNRATEMLLKFQFYDRYGVEEYYLYDPLKLDFSVWKREGDRLESVMFTADWTSPLLGIRFVMTDKELKIYRPDGQKFLSYVELETKQEKFAAKLRELGINPDLL